MKKTTKCYIATYFFSDNYGTRLQNFALEYSLKKLGVTPISISIDDFEVNFKTKVKYFLAKLPHITNKQRKWSDIIEKGKVFKNFNSKINSQKFTYKNLYKNDFSDAFAIVGSDQVWLPNHLNTHPKHQQLYFLEFIEKSKRYSYAPSFGVDKIPPEMHDIYKKAFENFNCITVREHEGAKIVKELTNSEVAVMPDPVFLLTNDEWMNLIQENKRKKYALVYFLDPLSNFQKQEIKRYALNNQLEVVYIAGNEINNYAITPSPEEFVGLFAGAEYIFTDSFHGCSFSIILNKSFAVFKRKTVKQFSRVRTLLKKYQSEHCIIEKEDNLDIDKLPEIKNSIKAIHNKERTIGLEYLDSIIKQEEKRNYEN